MESPPGPGVVGKVPATLKNLTRVVKYRQELGSHGGGLRGVTAELGERDPQDTWRTVSRLAGSAKASWGSGSQLG